MGAFEAASTAAGGRCNSVRQAVCLRELDDFLGIIDWISGARDEWRTNFLGDVAGLYLVAQDADGMWRWADP